MNARRWSTANGERQAQRRPFAWGDAAPRPGGRTGAVAAWLAACAVGRRVGPGALFVALAALVLGPGLAPGYLLTLDMVFVPRFHVPWEALTSGQNSWGLLPVYLLLEAGTRLLPGDLLQKLVLVAILSGAGLGVFQAAPGPRAARLLAGLFYAANPFVYERLLAGQWLFLAGYALSPWAFGAMVRALAPAPRSRAGGGARPTLPGCWRWAARPVLLWSAAALVSVHHAVLLALPLVALALGQLAVGHRRAAGRAVAILALFLALNGWWLALSLVGGRFAASIDLSHYLAFAARPDPQYGLLLNLLALYGFWREHIEALLTKEALPVWPLWHSPLWAVMGLGLLGGLARRRRMALALGLAAMLGAATFAALGPSPQTYVVNNWLFEHLTPLRALRDPQKYVALVALAQSWALALGFGWLAAASRAMRWRRVAVSPSGLRAAQGALAPVLGLALAALVLLVNLRMLWGLSGQLRPVQYPPSWEAAARALAADPARGTLLVLPWQRYARFAFAGRTIGNPAPSYFGGAVLINPDPGLPRLRPVPATPAVEAVEALLRSKRPSWAETLRALGVTHVLATRVNGTLDDRGLAGELEWLLGDEQAVLYRVP